MFSVLSGVKRKNLRINVWGGVGGVEEGMVAAFRMGSPLINEDCQLIVSAIRSLEREPGVTPQVGVGKWLLRSQRELRVLQCYFGFGVWQLGTPSTWLCLILIVH